MSNHYILMFPNNYLPRIEIIWNRTMVWKNAPPHIFCANRLFSLIFSRYFKLIVKNCSSPLKFSSLIRRN